ncbi:MAG: hypothetical protein HC828_18555 [Blastochloris sp.]|nr:hypothetical protein [Blastochloris sp.]
MNRYIRPSLLLTLLLSVLLVVAPASAQNTGPIPISINQNLTASLTEEVPIVTFTLESTGAQGVQMQVLEITPGLAPSLTVIDPSGVVLQTVNNPGSASVAAEINLLTTGIHLIQVQSTNGTTGDFLLSVLAGDPPPPPTLLTLGQSLSETVRGDASQRVYSFSGNQTDVLLLTVRADTAVSGPVVTLSNADTNQTLGVSGAGLLGAQYRLPADASNYFVRVAYSGVLTEEPFTICVGTEGGSAVCPGGPVTQPPTPIVNVPTQPPFRPLDIPAGGNVRSRPH